MTAPRHGTRYMYARRGCRCDACRAANTTVKREYRQRRRERENYIAEVMRTDRYGPEFGGAVYINAPGHMYDRRHGTIIYMSLRRDTATIRLDNGVLARHIMWEEISTTEPRQRKGISRHGTMARYRWGCTCQACRRVNRKHVAEWRARKAA